MEGWCLGEGKACDDENTANPEGAEWVPCSLAEAIWCMEGRRGGVKRLRDRLGDSCWEKNKKPTTQMIIRQHPGPE